MYFAIWCREKRKNYTCNYYLLIYVYLFSVYCKPISGQTPNAYLCTFLIQENNYYKFPRTSYCFSLIFQFKILEIVHKYITFDMFIF